MITEKTESAIPKICPFDISVIGAITLLIPIIPKVLKISEPITLPTDKPNFFFKVAIIEVAISGKLVPAATIVAPIAQAEILKYSAIKTADETVKSDDFTKIAKLIIKIK